MRGYRITFLIIVLLSVASGYLVKRYTAREFDESLYLKELAPDILFYEKRGDPPYYPSDRGIIAFNSYDVRPEIRGYAGPIKLLIIIDNSGIIRALKILEHRETRNYVHYMETQEYLSQFVGKSVMDPFEIDRDIDGISRATVSVQALARTVRESSRTMAEKVFGLKVPTVTSPLRTVTSPLEEKASRPETIIYLALFLSALSLYWISRREKGFLRFRDISLALGIGVIGLYLSTPFSILHIYNILLMRLSSSLMFYILVSSILLSLFIAGRFYCGWLCPFGALSEFISRIPSRKWSIPEEIDRKWRRLKYLLLFFVTFLVLFTGVPEFGVYETYITLFSFNGTILQWTFVLLMILANLRVRRFWCRYLCPVGALTGMVTLPASGYRSSGECPVDNPPDLHISECIRCNRCFRREPCEG